MTNKRKPILHQYANASIVKLEKRKIMVYKKDESIMLEFLKAFDTEEEAKDVKRILVKHVRGKVAVTGLALSVDGALGLHAALTDYLIRIEKIRAEVTPRP